MARESLEVQDNSDISCTVHQMKTQGIQWEADCEVTRQTNQNRVISPFKKKCQNQIEEKI